MKQEGTPLVMNYKKNNHKRGRPLTLWYIPKKILKKIKLKEG